MHSSRGTNETWRIDVEIRLETVTRWEASELHVRTDGKDLGEIEEIYAMEADQLVYTVKLRLEGPFTGCVER